MHTDELRYPLNIYLGIACLKMMVVSTGGCRAGRFKFTSHKALSWNYFACFFLLSSMTLHIGSHTLCGALGCLQDTQRIRFTGRFSGTSSEIHGWMFTPAAALPARESPRMDFA